MTFQISRDHPIPQAGTDPDRLRFANRGQITRELVSAGVHVEKPADCVPALRAALEHDGPAIIEVVIDPHEPPIPAKVKKEQLSKLFEALKAGTPNRKTIAMQMVKDMLDESSFAASPGSSIPNPIAKVAEKVADVATRHPKDS